MPIWLNALGGPPCFITTAAGSWRVSLLLTLFTNCLKCVYACCPVYVMRAWPARLIPATGDSDGCEDLAPPNTISTMTSSSFRSVHASRICWMKRLSNCVFNIENNVFDINIIISYENNRLTTPITARSQKGLNKLCSNIESRKLCFYLLRYRPLLNPAH